MNDLISIIVPIYNVEPYIDECLYSIISQTYRNIEIILINDGSTDRSGQIAEKYKTLDDRVVLIHKKNGGVSKARNIGVELARGKYICFADSDDILASDYIEYLYELMKNNEVDISLTTRYLSKKQNFVYSKDTIEIKTGEQALIEILLHKIPIGVYCKLFKSEIIKKNDLRFFEDLYVGEGFNFNCKAFQYAKRVAFSNRGIYFYRTDNPTSAVSLFRTDKWENALYALDKIDQNIMCPNAKIKNAVGYARWFDGIYILKKMIIENVLKDNFSLQEKCIFEIKNNSSCALKCDVSAKQRIRCRLYKVAPVFFCYFDRFVVSILRLLRGKL